MGTETSDHGQGPVQLWMTPFTGQPCSVRRVTQPHPTFLSTVYSLALSGQLEQVRPVTSFVMRLLWLVGNDQTVFGWVLRSLMTQSQIYWTKNDEPASNTTMYFRLRTREEERWIIMTNNSARQSCETVFHLMTGHAAKELCKVGGQCQHASATPDRTQLLQRPLHALYSPLQAEELLTPSPSADFGIYHSHCQTPATPNNEAFHRSTNAFLTSQRPMVCTFTKKKKNKKADKAGAPEGCGES